MTTLALENLYQSVKTEFELDQINAVNVFGWREPAQHIGTLPRIAWVPGDASSSLGDVTAPMFPGQNPRSVAQLTELFTVYLTGFDPRDPENEQAQYHVGRMLYEAWYTSVYRASHGNFRVRSQQWMTDRRERRFGVTLRVVCEVNAPIVEALPDEPLVGSAFAGLTDAVDAVAAAQANSETLHAELTVELNDTPDPTEEI